ncbi:MAG TPA: N-acetylmannosamine-6-phosphate 2-epimerase [Firmicutes bacterium]|nr:N-acetylmannosamine-6-phosphate 2-epimerase [Bacillota bacterium]
MDLSSWEGGLIVSCQAPAGDPLHDPAIMAAMARAAELGGAVGIRANGPEDIAAIRKAVGLPIIGIFKQKLEGFPVYITPTLAAARAVVEAGADIVAIDATPRRRPGGWTAPELIDAIHRELKVPVMADISTFAEGLAAARAGADLVATTLSGYTEESLTGAAPLQGPDLDLVRQLASSVSVPVICEGRVHSPADLVAALEAGAFAVVVGTAITRPQWITEQFVLASRQRKGGMGSEVREKEPVARNR